MPPEHMRLPGGGSRHKVSVVAAISREVTNPQAVQQKLESSRLRRVCQGAPRVEANAAAADDEEQLGRQQVFAMMFEEDADVAAQPAKRQKTRKKKDARRGKKRGFYIGRVQQIVKYYGPN